MGTDSIASPWQVYWGLENMKVTGQCWQPTDKFLWAMQVTTHRGYWESNTALLMGSVFVFLSLSLSPAYRRQFISLTPLCNISHGSFLCATVAVFCTVCWYSQPAPLYSSIWTTMSRLSFLLGTWTCLSVSLSWWSGPDWLCSGQSLLPNWTTQKQDGQIWLAV